jgi:anthranilate phosphoribosyltransferase
VIQQAINHVVNGKDLSEEEMMGAMEQIMEGEATPAQIGAFLIALRMKGETVDEITGAAKVMRAKSTTIPCGNSGISIDRDEINVDTETIVDTCGTGGDGTQTFNISSTTAFVVAGAGLKVAKHGNRAISSRCGSADVIEALGVSLDLTPEQIGACIDKVGIGFLYAPLLHSAMRHAVGPRREIGLRTIFNLLGPLTNPAGANIQVLGVYQEDLTERLAQVLDRLGCNSAFVVHGEGSYDEISIIGPTRLTRLNHGKIETTTLVPEDLGLRRAKPEEIRGGDSSKNAAVTLGVLKGESGAPRDIVLLNAAAVFVAAERAENLQQGIAVAAESIDSGQALQKLQELVTMSKDLVQ